MQDRLLQRLVGRANLPALQEFLGMAKRHARQSGHLPQPVLKANIRKKRNASA